MSSYRNEMGCGTIEGNSTSDESVPQKNARSEAITMKEK